MSPIMKKSYLQAIKNKSIEIPLVDVDIFKADIYSLGLTFLKAATNIKNIG